MMVEEVDRRILLVEDEALITMAERQTIERFGYVVDVAGTGEQAVEMELLC